MNSFHQNVLALTRDEQYFDKRLDHFSGLSEVSKIQGKFIQISIMYISLVVLWHQVVVLGMKQLLHHVSREQKTTNWVVTPHIAYPESNSEQ